MPAAVLRVAVVFEYPVLNGGEHSMLAVMDQLHGRAVDFCALAPATGPLSAALNQRGIACRPWHVVDRAGQRLSRSDLIGRLVDFAASSGVDVVHANSLSMSRVLGAAAARIRQPCCGHLRDILRLSRGAVADLNGNTRLLAVSQATRAFHTQQGVDPQRIDVLYNGVDCSRFQPRPRNERLRAELGAGPDSLLVLQIGQVSLRKAQDVYVAAAVRTAVQCPRMQFVMVGQRHSQKRESIEFEQSLVRQVAAAGLEHRIQFLGRRDDIPQLMNSSDVLVHTARQEPLGRVLLEAGASGLPIVATHVGGTREIFPDASSAIVVPPDDVQAVSTTLEELADSLQHRSRLATAARQQVCQRFAAEQSATALHACWRSLAAGQCPSADSDSPAAEGLL